MDYLTIIIHTLKGKFENNIILYNIKAQEHILNKGPFYELNIYSVKLQWLGSMKLKAILGSFYSLYILIFIIIHSPALVHSISLKRENF